MTSRRAFIQSLGLTGGAVAAASVSPVAMAALPELIMKEDPNTAPPHLPQGVTGAGRPYNPSRYTHLPALYPIALSDEHTERADELGEAGI